VRVCWVTTFLVAAPVAATVLDAPVYIKVIGACAGVMAPLYLWAALRTFIVIGSNSVTMRGARGPAITFQAGDATVKVTRAMNGLYSTAPVVTLNRTSDGSCAATPLASFSASVREEIPSRLRSVLDTS